MAFLLIAGILVASWRLTTTNWTDHLIRLQGLFLLAGYLGMLLGHSRFANWLAILLGGAYGAFFIPWQLGLTIYEDLQWAERLRSLWGRLLFSVNQTLSSENVEDPILFLSLMAILLWILGLHAGYILMRHRAAWRAGIPIGLMMIVIQTYDAFYVRRVWYLAVYLGLLLLLVSRSYLLDQRETWRRRGTHFHTDIGSDILRYTAMAASLLVVLAWVTPALVSSKNPARTVWDTLTQPWRDLQSAYGGAAFYSLDAGPVKINDTYAENLLLGRGTAQGTKIVMTIEVLDDAPSPPRFYWRDRVYASYANGTWSSGFGSTSRVEAEDNQLLFQAYEGRDVGTVRITSGRNIQLLHTPTQPISVSRNADFIYAPNADGTWDIAALNAVGVLRSGETYEAEGYFTDVTVRQLQAAGTEYPDWVLERYLQIPEEISTRTLELAAQLAEGEENAFDIASAITEWLRENINYVDEVGEIPEGFEPIDYMLFEDQQGFCNYYATAEILMLRSLGIPARLAVGYAQGSAEDSNLLLGGATTEKNQFLEGIALETRFFTVRQEQAHAWPEVYFPGYGWVEFEPTVNQLPLERPLDEESEVLPAANVSLPDIQPQDETPNEIDASVLEARLIEEEAQERAAQMRSQLLILSSLAIILIFMVLWARYRRRGGLAVPVLLERGIERLNLHAPQTLRRWSSYAQLEPLPKAFMEINSALRRLGTPPKRGDTPLERAQALTRRIPRLGELIEALYQRYESALYKEEASNEEGVEQARWTIRLASWVERAKQGLRRWQRKPQDWREELGTKGEKKG